MSQHKMSEGWIKLNRSLLNWEWFKDFNTLAVWLYLLLICNIEPTPYQGIIIDRGSCHTSRREIAEATGLTEDQVRTALNHLKNTDQITNLRKRNFSVITVLNYDKYQGKSPTKSPQKSPNLYNKKKPLLNKGKKGETNKSVSTDSSPTLEEWKRKEGIR